MEVPKTDVGKGRIERPGGPARIAEGLPDEAGCGNQGSGLFLALTAHFPFQSSYAALPASFFARVAPTPVAAPRLIKLNRQLALQLGLDPDLLETPEGAEILAGKRVPEGADPIAMAYAGHQFGQF